MKVRRSAKKIQTKPAKDAALIRECVIFAASIAAHDAVFEADPDGNKAIATALGDRHHDRADLALEKIAHTTATTAEGLQAKARILPMVIDASAGSMEKTDEAFFRSFAADVRAFLEPILHEHWMAAVVAMNGPSPLAGKVGRASLASK